VNYTKESEDSSKKMGVSLNKDIILSNLGVFRSQLFRISSKKLFI